MDWEKAFIYSITGFMIILMTTLTIIVSIIYFNIIIGIFYLMLGIVAFGTILIKKLSDWWENEKSSKK